MKKLIVLFSLILVLLPLSVLAHGGVEHNTDDAVITIYQTPISPVTREHVETDFVFADKQGNRLANMPVSLSVTDTHLGNAKEDRVILTKNYKTDENGLLRFGFRYAKPDYYDIDLDFDVGGKPQEGGILLQIRNPYKNWYSLTYVFVLLLGLAAGYLLTNRHCLAKTGK